MRPRAPDLFDPVLRSSPLNLYLLEIGSIPVLERRRELELGRRVRSGDRAAVDALVLHNLRFVVLIARRYVRHGVPLEDLIEEGNIGLIRAAERFDERYGFRFITYAVYWIRQAIMRHLDRCSSLIRVPIRTRRQLALVRQARARLPHLLDREPTLEEIAATAGIEPERLVELRGLPLQSLSLDRPNSGSGPDFEVEALADSDALAFESQVEADLSGARVRAALLRLESRTADIVARYWGLRGSAPESLETIGRHYGITRERARQVRDRGMSQLRWILEREGKRRRMGVASHSARLGVSTPQSRERDSIRAGVASIGRRTP